MNMLCSKTRYKLVSQNKWPGEHDKRRAHTGFGLVSGWPGHYFYNALINYTIPHHYGVPACIIHEPNLSKDRASRVNIAKQVVHCLINYVPEERGLPRDEGDRARCDAPT